MSKKLPTIWPADPHTLAKIEILKGYLGAWTPILATTRSTPIVYVDGFAGPGEYSGGQDGSPIAAAKVVLEVIRQNANRIKTAGIHLVFIENDRERHGRLAQRVSDFTSANPRLHIHGPFLGNFATTLGSVHQTLPAAFDADTPIFLFVDPFGATDTPFDVLRQAMTGRSAELLINLDADGIRRVYQAGNNNRDEQLTALFGGDCWKQFDAYRNDSLRLQREILGLYQKRLYSIPDVKYVWSFEMRGGRDSLNYFLVFATKHPLGMEKMKEAMKKISQATDYRFSDADVHQQHLFFQDDQKDVEMWAQEMWDSFSANGQVSWEDILHFALTRTPFPNPKSMLQHLEREGRLEVTSPSGINRRRFSFPDGTVASLRFVKKSGGSVHEQQQLF